MKKQIVAAALAGAAVTAVAIGAGSTPVTIDAGTGEVLTFVVAGEFGSEQEALDANASYAFGDLQGFYVVPTADIEGQAPGRWLLASAFRTLAGAAEFEELAFAAGADALRQVTGRYLGSAFVGLGQEPSPDDTGPLIGGPPVQPR